METMSPTISKLAEALSKVQAVIEGSKLDSNNPFFKSRYSTLSSVWDACRKPIAENGLSVVQTMEPVEGKCAVTTTLLHVSGEWIRGTVTMKPVKDDPQAVGSCITYARRYSLAAIIGISPEDDDGNDGSGRNDMDQRPPADRRPAQTAPEAAKEADRPLPWEEGGPAPVPTTGTINASLKKITQAKFTALQGVLKANKIDPKKWKTWLIETHGFDSVAAVTEAAYQEIFDTVTKHPGTISGEREPGQD